MGKKLVLSCPRCSSEDTVRNGHHHQGKIQFFCNSCNKYFYEDPAKGYPPTNIPFPIIAYSLYFRKKIPAFSNMREFRKFVSQWLNCLGVKKRKVSRQIIHHWIKNYEPPLNKNITFRETRDYCHRILQEKLEGKSKEIIKKKTHPYKETLHYLEQTLGKKFCIELARHDPVFFNELIDIVSKQELYCHRPVVEDEKPTKGMFFKGVVR